MPRQSRSALWRAYVVRCTFAKVGPISGRRVAGAEQPTSAGNAIPPSVWLIQRHGWCNLQLFPTSKTAWSGLGPGTPTMDITVGDERATVKPAGEIDLATARDVQERATQLLHRPIDHLTFDMREVVMVDSVGLATLLRVAQQAEAADCAFTLLNPSPLLRRVLHVTGLSRVLNVQTSKD
jgi:anti-sigma B factor antagonist